MIVYNREDKKLVVPSALGNFGNAGGGSGSGLTPEEVAEIASAVTEAAIEEYDTEIQVDLEEIRDAISGNTDTLLDLAVIAAMSVADRVALFDEVFEKASNGERIYIKGLVQEETVRTAVLPLVSYRPETNPVLHQGGNLYFAAKGDTDNIYFHIGLTSEGSIDPTSGNIIKRNIYNLPTASAEVKGGVRIGSGFTMAQDVISVDTTGLVTDGDLAPFVAELSAATEDLAALSGSVNDIRSDVGTLSGATSDILSDIEALSGITESVSGAVDTLSGITTANTENIATLSAATETISGSLGNYATTAITNGLSTDITALSGVSSALTESVSALTANDNIAFFNLIKDYGNSNEELARLYDDMDAANTAGKTVVALSNFATGDTQNAAVFVTFRKDSNGGFYGAGSGVHYNGTTYIAARAVPIFRRDDYYNVIKKDGHFYFSDMATIAPYTLPTAAANTKGGVKVGSGLIMNSETMSVNIGEGLAFSGNTLVVSGISGGGGIEKVDSLPSTAQEGDMVWLNGHTETGFTFYASWTDWGATATLGYVDGDEVYFDGERTVFGHWKGKIRFRRDADHLYADYLGGSSASVSGADGVNSNIEFPFIGSFYAFRNGMWTKVATDYVIDFNASDPVCKQVFLEIYEGLSDFDGSNLVIRYVQDSSWPYPREFRPYSARWYGVDCQSSDDRVSPAMDGYYGRISVDINRLTYNYQEDSLDFGTLVGTKQTASAEEVSRIAVYKPTFVRFGNDDRGGLTYDADNNRFEYDSGYITPGDTTSAYPDLIDKLFTDYIFDGGTIWTGSEYLYPQNTNKLIVVKNGETKTYAAPRMTRRQLSSTVTIDGVDFDWEVTYDYSDWTLTAYYAGNGRNDAANLRISANA